MRVYANSYLEADVALQGGLYDFLMDCHRKHMTNQSVLLLLHDKGYDASDETIRKWYRLMFTLVEVDESVA